VGDCRGNLETAVARLGDELRIEVSGVSSVYITEPVGRKDQPEFFNMAVELETSLEPQDLLGVCRDVEKVQGRSTLTSFYTSKYK
jgi:2-amino-4-hydroxy-6-hydroxymethyldihydropteridine diphosphokinase